MWLESNEVDLSHSVRCQSVKWTAIYHSRVGGTVPFRARAALHNVNVHMHRQDKMLVRLAFLYFHQFKLDSLAAIIDLTASERSCAGSKIFQMLFQYQARLRDNIEARCRHWVMITR